VTPFTVSIMQPYFLPYAGYFRLFAASDLFVIYDCVQFPRRGWVHRNRLPDAVGIHRWLTLPLARAPQDVLIRDLRFPSDARDIFTRRLRRFPLVAHAGRASDPIIDVLQDLGETPVDYIERLLRSIVERLGLPWNVIRSSSLAVPASFRSQERIIEIARRVGAQRYVNAPGGRALYDSRGFAAAGIELRLLADYPGPASSILARILLESPDTLAGEIVATAMTQEP